ncbi:hypothetical protein M758_3G063200 [Ceratodon purpureus]|uniref:Glutathione transferase n=1 Tax=Ceratodon purpureus TaxID=3225 RepID=A0A8T0II48_CERPU|nr:hypothetical protein KC19_3G063900 [Ceratodon purpureus]KAG0621981.1 hypothetical protein M758_3G063200 [Ceratodon purpureus]
MAGRSTGLKLYVDLLSQPARAVTIFCRVNGIEAEEIYVQVANGDCRTEEFKQINSACKVPTIVDDGFKLHESHAILRYLATTRNVADHWYPQDPERRALIDSVLDWHHLNLRYNAFLIIVHRVISVLPGIKKGIYPEHNEAVAEEAKVGLNRALEYVETVLLNGPNEFLENQKEVSIADLSLVCEIKQLLWLESSEQEELLGSRKRIQAWLEAVEKATNPQFNEVHSKLYGMAKHLQDGRKSKEEASQ